MSGSCGYNLVKQFGIRVEQAKAQLGWCFATVCGSEGGHPGHTKGPMRPKTSFFGHKWVWWLQSGGTVWNKGGRSHCASVVMHRNSFVGQVGHRGSHGAPIGSKTAKNCPWNHTWIWWLQSGGSASIKVGYSKGIAQAIYWNNFLCTKG